MGGVLKVEIQAEVRGPLADGSAAQALSGWAHDVAQILGDEGVKELRAWPFKSSRGGGFQKNLHVIQNGPEARIPGPAIEGVTWSPWLEGSSKRNGSTRFKGYHLFRKTRQDLQKRAPEIGQRELDKIMPRLG